METACSPPTESNKQVCSLVRARGEQCGRLLFIAFRAKRALQSAWAPPLISVLCSIRRLERKGMGIWCGVIVSMLRCPSPPPLAVFRFVISISLVRMPPRLCNVLDGLPRHGKSVHRHFSLKPPLRPRQRHGKGTRTSRERRVNSRMCLQCVLVSANLERHS